MKRKNGVLGKWICENRYPDNEENREINELLNSFSSEQREVLAKLVQEARMGGIHDVLAYMIEKMDCEGLVLSRNEEVLLYDEFESMHYDFVCRCEGDE